MAYSKYYTHLEEDDIPKGTLAHIKRRLCNDYLNARYNVDLQPAWKIGRWLVPLLGRKKKQIEESVRHLPTTPGILVDIGCGNGDYLRTAMRLGWEAWGVDLDPKAVETARKTGATVLQGGFPDTGLPSAYFDVMTLSHVIEHVHDPLTALQEAFRVLKPGGQIWLATPNMESFGHARFGADWRGLEPPRHLSILTSYGLKKVLECVGFIHLTAKPCGAHARWFYRSSNRISKGEDPNDSDAPDLPLRLRLAAEIANFRAAQNTSRCETIVVTAKRPK
ncbi:methyltransferase domain-containing protein [Candidatus Igneacidithiobacillus taiwanensis]|uniref:class I SAM-dependent methyltransferase n=1 Tax=Candidatus Igneacidithiobacillus taiwanensis TaxID=1945924 RepID=UPI00289FD097|nr:methyltransferase domain-containing protein [Candidatus Igneacidithiobacillus taiwanensis]